MKMTQLIVTLSVLVLLSMWYKCVVSFKLRVCRSTGRRMTLSQLYVAPSTQVHLADEKKLFFSQKSFENMGLTPTMVECTTALNIYKPSKIQALSFFGISTGKPCIIADQTGSGKTLAYLLPTVQRMIMDRKTEKGKALSKVSPYIVVMTPTAELAM